MKIDAGGRALQGRRYSLLPGASDVVMPLAPFDVFDQPAFTSEYNIDVRHACKRRLTVQYNKLNSD